MHNNDEQTKSGAVSRALAGSLLRGSNIPTIRQRNNTTRHQPFFFNSKRDSLCRASRVARCFTSREGDYRDDITAIVVRLNPFDLRKAASASVKVIL